MSSKRSRFSTTHVGNSGPHISPLRGAPRLWARQCITVFDNGVGLFPVLLRYPLRCLAFLGYLALPLLHRPHLCLCEILASLYRNCAQLHGPDKRLPVGPPAMGESWRSSLGPNRSPLCIRLSRCVFKGTLNHHSILLHSSPPLRFSPL